MLAKRNLIYLILLPFLSGVLSSIAWHSSYFFFLQFFAYVPFFISVNEVRKEDKTFINRLLRLFLITTIFRGAFLLLVAFWVYQLAESVAIIYILIEAIALTAFLSLILIRRLPLISIVFLFVIYEYTVQKYLFNSPVFLLGHSMSNRIELIQYYKYLGIEGGALILYLLNYSFYRLYAKRKVFLLDKITFATFGLISIISLLIFYFKEEIEMDPERSVSIVHVDINSKDTTYVRNPIPLIDSVAHVAAPNSLVILPEVFFNSYGWAEDIEKNKTSIHIDSIAKANDQSYLFGAYLFSIARKNQRTPQTRYMENYDVYFNSHNTSVLIDNRVRVRSKEEFITFLEYVPNNKISQWINQYVTDIGDDRKVTTLIRNNSFSYKNKKLVSLICYETLFPMRVAEWSKDKDLIVIHANEDWHKFDALSTNYFNTNKAMAIQSGLPVYRVSNNGYSSYISPKGETNYIKDTGTSFALLEVGIPVRSEKSFYTNITGYTYLLSLLTLITLFGISFKKKTKET